MRRPVPGLLHCPTSSPRVPSWDALQMPQPSGVSTRMRFSERDTPAVQVSRRPRMPRVPPDRPLRVQEGPQQGWYCVASCGHPRPVAGRVDTAVNQVGWQIANRAKQQEICHARQRRRIALDAVQGLERLHAVICAIRKTRLNFVSILSATRHFFLLSRTTADETGEHLRPCQNCASTRSTLQQSRRS